MSFWPFTNSLNNNSRLQKFLDSVLDPAAVSVEDLVGDLELSLEIVSELHSIKGNYGRDAGNFPFQQQQQQQAQSQQQQQQQQQQSGQLELLAQHLANEDDHALTPVGPSSFNNNNADSGSVSSYSEAGGGGNLSKDARGAKLLEILIQPHILNGFLDFIVESVGFFDEDAKAAELAAKTAGELDTVKEAEQKPLTRNKAELPDPDKNDAALDIIQEEDENELEELENQEADEDEEKGDEDEEESSQDKMRRYIQTSSDILSIDLWIISNRIIETPVIISKLWLILSLPQLLEVSPLVTYLIHILDQLMDANSIELLNFIRRQPDLVDTFLGKIEIPMLMDFFLRVIQTDKIDYPTGILETLLLQKLIPQLIDILKPKDSQFNDEDSDGASSGIPDAHIFFKQTAATDFIKALVTISSNTALAINLETNIGPNQLTRELVSKEIIETIVKDIILFKPPKGSKIKTNKHGINNCVGIIIELIRKNNSDYDTNCGTYSLENNQQNNGGGGQNAGAEVNSYVMFQWLKDFEQNPPGTRDPIYLGEMLEIFSDHLDQLADLMVIAPEKEKELGFTNFKLSELIAELLHCSNMILLNSKKIKKVIKAREYVRSQQSKRLKRALNESMLGEDGLEDVTHGLDDVSLDNISLLSNRRKLDEITMSNDDYDDGEESLMMLELDAEDSHSDSDDEPVISPENPFVGVERDNAIRLNPCIGDKFKIDLVDLGLLEQIVRKFTEYPWHNFFHNVVFDLVQQIFNGKLNSYNSFLIVELFKPEKCNLTGLIYVAYREKLEPRPGYLGHLILISEEIVKFTSLYKPDLISPIIVDAVTSEDWEWFVTEVLLKTREVYNAVLGAAHGFEDDDEDDIKKDDDDDVFGFDSGTVGYLDLENYGNGSKVIVLGDKDNHEEFVNDGSNGGAEDDDEIENNRDNMEDEDEDEIEEDMPDVKLTSSLVGTVDGVSEVGGNEGAIELDGDGIESEFLENLSGSSSSEDDDEDDIEDSATNDDDNELRRVPKHNS